MKLDYDTLAYEYAQHRRVHPDVLKGLMEGGQLTRTSTVLEVGCGTGNYIVGIAQAIGCDCWGVEPSARMLSQAREQSSSVHWLAGRAEKLDLPGGFFNLVFSMDVVHHVADRPAYFREAYRVLQPGGRLCTVTDSAEIIQQRRPLSVYFPETVAVEVERYPAIAELRRMLVETGFTNLAEVTVEFAYTISDLRPYRDKAFSCLHLISPAAFEKGLREMERDLRSQPIPGLSRYLLLWGTKLGLQNGNCHELTQISTNKEKISEISVNSWLFFSVRSCQRMKNE